MTAAFQLWLQQAEADLAALAERQADFERRVAQRQAAGNHRAHVVRDDDQRPGDRRQAADLLSRAICGDSLGVTTAALSALRAGRLTFVIEAMAALVVAATPQLTSSEVVDRLRAEAVGQVSNS